MQGSSVFSSRGFWLLALLVLAFDQLSKWIALSYLPEAPEAVYVAPFFNLRLVYNAGLSFGVWGGSAGTAKVWTILIISIVLTIGIVWWMRKESSRIGTSALAMILGGACGNMLDRARTHTVVDFLDLHVMHWHWPVFNLADSAIVLGVGALMWLQLFRPRGR